MAEVILDRLLSREHRIHLKGGLSGHCSVSVNGNWRLIFAFESGDAILVDCQDYH